MRAQRDGLGYNPPLQQTKKPQLLTTLRNLHGVIPVPYVIRRYLVSATRDRQNDTLLV